MIVKEQNGNHWLLTGWENNNEASAYAIGEGYDSSNATANITTLTRYDGVDASASDGKLSQGSLNVNNDVFCKNRDSSGTELSPRQQRTFVLNR